MFIAMNNFKVAPGKGEEFERIWRERDTYLKDVPGIIRFALLRGDPEKLGRLRMAPEFERLTMRAGVCLDGVGVVSAAIGAGVTRQMGAWKEAIADLV